MNLENYIKDLPPDLQEKARACGSVEDLLALAKEAQIPVPDEALEAIAGGDGSDPENCKREIKCPKCGSKNYKVIKGINTDVALFIVLNATIAGTSGRSWISSATENRACAGNAFPVSRAPDIKHQKRAGSRRGARSMF